MSYKYLDHTADVKFKAEGKTLEEAFISAADALNDTIYGDIKILEQDEKEVIIEGRDLESLLYNFLEEFLYLLDAEDFLVANIKSIEIDREDFLVKAVLSGDKAEHYKFTNDVKAITYNEMKVEFVDDKEEWVIEVVIDV